jgi:hypothetical protein
MLKSVNDINNFKLKFFNKLLKIRGNNPLFDKFLLNIPLANTGYVIGGFLRDIVNNRESRDIDIVFDISQEKLIGFLESSGLTYKVNRMSGVKILLKEFEADIWTINNNWAFKNKVVKKNDNNILESLANGCFYNYDSLVINIRKGTVSVKNYNDFVNSNQLDILRKADAYKNRNPTWEANILRALYIKKLYNVNFSENCLSYLARKVLELNTCFEDPAMRINDIKSKYDKYSNLLSDQEIFDGISQLCYEFGSLSRKNIDQNQMSLNL